MTPILIIKVEVSLDNKVLDFIFILALAVDVEGLVSSYEDKGKDSSTPKITFDAIWTFHENFR
eukprot:CAMPEP_0201737868 /NCGR_PEP_ID=MMETSP0593-20130828/43510_1 /ASSEMBLY_ACC=CAM_ASM_000672 /TAXON_ID=267983 /ORGANISM="Skeletonema japonicum, Strain CCMP2506" /LENGTH=62 /DNA_ID=CAMNT_0048231937 /DNA_START=46 /DNA_END=230 /DNA_ORIENTATION=-